MEVFCLQEFKDEFDKLIKKKSYESVEQEIIDYFLLDKKVSDVNNGRCLNNNHKTPYLKKRLDGSGGFRVYFLLLIVKEKLYLMFVHPKSGSMGAENITDEKKSSLYKDILRAITSNDNLLRVTINQEKTKIIFSKL